jgi:cell division protease FtsH
LFRTVRVEDPGLVDELVAKHVRFVGVHPGFLTQFLLAWVLPISLLAGAWLLLSRRFAAGSGVMSFGKSRARLVADRDTGVRFDDVAGCDEAKAELVEVVDFLRNAERYRALGARIPKGVLLVGPPGTGKTLIARAVAGEAHVPFFSLSGSDFVEMFVGVGAARVRDLFEQAKQQSPCIVFIDELDAIGRQRGVQMGMVNDEREQTLNQLLVEMDGFEANTGVILLAATNRPDVLDRALLRPGRFDRQVVVDAPDLEGREAILRVHVRGKPMGPDVDLARLARATPGFSGADLANVVNEAALLAARLGEHSIAQKHLEEAVEKVVAGPERRSRRLREEEKRRVAFHEVGHALVAAFCEHADPVHKISIVPRGRAALGYTLQLPTGDQFVLQRSALLDRVRGLLGGRAAEEVVFGEVSTGAQNDLERATALVRQMVTMYGMGESVGLMHAARPREGIFAGAEGGLQRDCAEATAREIDEEVRRMLDQAYADALRILHEHRDGLDAAAGELLQRETLDAETFRHLVGAPPPPP